MRLPFDLACPPAEPPVGCQDLEKWQRGYDLHRRHMADAHGMCKPCRQKAPCFSLQLAQRSMIDGYIGEPQHQQLPGPPRIVRTSVCRWCGQQVGLHSWWGWLHLEGAFILCRAPAFGSPPLCVAEPEFSYPDRLAQSQRLQPPRLLTSSSRFYVRAEPSPRGTYPEAGRASLGIDPAPKGGDRW